MNRDEFRQWISDNFNIPDDNCTLAPEMLESILDYAEAICKTDGEYAAYSFLSEMLPSIPERDILRFAVYKYDENSSGDQYKVKQINRMLEHETSDAEFHYGARLTHWHGDTNALTIDAGGLRVLSEYYSTHKTDLRNGEDD